MDIDIDTPTTFDPLTVFSTAVRASMIRNDEVIPHNCGVYFQNIARDKITHLAAIPYKIAEELGYFKIDFLHLNILDYFESKAEIRGLLKKQPDWELLQDKDVVARLFQIHGHWNLVAKIKPQSVLELADTIALIRPAKRHLVDQYIQEPNKEKIRTILYKKPDDGTYYYKKPHAVAYAHNVVLQLHLIQAGIL